MAVELPPVPSANTARDTRIPKTSRSPDRYPIPEGGAEDRAELAEVYERIEHTQRPVLDEGKTTCCYAKSEKTWVEDPQGVQWETFLTTGEITVYGGDAVAGARARKCCAPS